MEPPECHSILRGVELGDDLLGGSPWQSQTLHQLVEAQRTQQLHVNLLGPEMLDVPLEVQRSQELLHTHPRGLIIQALTHLFAWQVPSDLLSLGPSLMGFVHSLSFLFPFLQFLFR